MKKWIIVSIVAGILVFFGIITHLAIRTIKTVASDSTRQEQVSRLPKYRTRPIDVAPPNELISYPVTVTYEDSKQISFKIDTSVKNRNQFGWWGNKPTTCSFTLSKETGRGRWHQSYPVAQGELVVLNQTIKNGLWSEIQVGQTLNGKVLSKFALEKF